MPHVEVSGNEGSLDESEAVDDEGEDVSNCLGGDVLHGLVVR